MDHCDVIQPQIPVYLTNPMNPSETIRSSVFSKKVQVFQFQKRGLASLRTNWFFEPEPRLLPESRLNLIKI